MILAMLDGHLADGRYEDAMSEALVRVLGLGERDLAQLRGADKIWAGMVALAPSLRAQTQIMAESAGSVDRFAGIDLPTLLLVGEYSDPTTFGSSVARLAAVMPRARAVTLGGQGHSAMSRGPR
jgi:pimeloyl-ACP methyl ester carboxylesterase